jgi:predicted metal-dependent hydrolase
MDRALRVGAAVFNAGDHHAAHDAWEDAWLELPEGTPDERLLRGLIQYTAAVYHARNRNWSGAAGLASSAGEYLDGLDDDYRGVNVGSVRASLERLAADPEFAERARPLPLRVDGRTVEADHLPFADAAAAAKLVAGDDDVYDERVIEDAVRYAAEEVERDEQGIGDARSATRYVAFVFDFVGDGKNRDVLYERLVAHVERERARERDVSGLFD